MTGTYHISVVYLSRVSFKTYTVYVANPSKAGCLVLRKRGEEPIYLSDGFGDRMLFDLPGAERLLRMTIVAERLLRMTIVKEVPE